MKLNILFEEFTVESIKTILSDQNISKFFRNKAVRNALLDNQGSFIEGAMDVDDLYDLRLQANSATINSRKDLSISIYISSKDDGCSTELIIAEKDIEAFVKLVKQLINRKTGSSFDESVSKFFYDELAYLL